MRGTRWRVLFVDHESRLSGGQRDLVDLVSALDPARVEVHVALPADGPLARALAGHGATIHQVPMASALRELSRWELTRRPDRALRPVAAAARSATSLAGLARRIRPDVVHSNSMKAHLLAAPAARSSAARLVWHVRDVIEIGWLRRAFALGAGTLPDRVICLSRVAAAQFDGTRAADRARVVYNGIRPHATTEEEVDSWRRRFGGAPGGGPVVGIVGQIARWKGQDTFLEAAAILTRSRPDLDARFAVVGECLFARNEGSYERGLHARAAQLGLDGRLTWTGPVDPIEPVMGAFDVAVHASRLPEPFGRVIVEAMAAGTPVVASARGAGPEIVPSDGSAGRLVDPEDPARLAAAVGEVLDVLGDPDPARGRGMRRAAREAAAGFGLDATAAGVLGVYEELG